MVEKKFQNERGGMLLEQSLVLLGSDLGNGRRPPSDRRSPSSGARSSDGELRWRGPA